MQTTAPVKSAERTLDLLEFIGRNGNAASQSDIVVGLGVPKGSLSKLLATMREREYVAFDADAKVYRLGPAVQALVAQAQAAADVATLALPVLQWATEVTGEASSYTALRNDEMERMCGVDSEQPLSYRMNNNKRFPLYSSSGGKAVLADMPKALREAYLSRAKLQKLTPSTVASVTALRAQLATIAAEGVAVSRNEHTQGVVALAVAIRRAQGEAPVGAITIVVPDARFNHKLEALCRKTLKTARARIEKAMQMAGVQAG
ncbi:Negative regulator of allantoin and glyoxylate utilization operons [Variovorax sp. PBL-H6]|uniref:IclR family transcriptional regulator n=1 Tax=Variovorax sp. PBL-H6 TaxID=434009 RepID=UPI001315B5CE|nr:IclR family transcriptional regulator [Variovorax sp. PBL-H6]VTU39591.1 Negative regulator of allantoin and glyoxylate utilization operons [Variovorax sp. PBL-H6]